MRDTRRPPPGGDGERTPPAVLAAEAPLASTAAAARCSAERAFEVLAVSVGLRGRRAPAANTFAAAMARLLRRPPLRPCALDESRPGLELGVARDTTGCGLARGMAALALATPPPPRTTPAPARRTDLATRVEGKRALEAVPLEAADVFALLAARRRCARAATRPEPWARVGRASRAPVEKARSMGTGSCGPWRSRCSTTRWRAVQFARPAMPLATPGMPAPAAAPCLRTMAVTTARQALSSLCAMRAFGAAAHRVAKKRAPACPSVSGAGS